MELELSTSPRATWVWAPSPEDATAVQELLGRAGCITSPVTTDHAGGRVLNVDIGVDALTALEALTAFGHTLRWHRSQHALNREDNLYGIPVRA